jgi:hypothetical protein
MSGVLKGYSMYRVTVLRGVKIVERNCFDDLSLATKHYDFLIVRYIEEKMDWKVKISLKNNKEIIKSC